MGIIVRQGFKSSIVSYIGVVIGIFNILILYNQYLTQEQLGLYASTLLTFPVIYMSFAFWASHRSLCGFTAGFRTTNREGNFLHSLSLHH
jgi:hypothetical protein